MSLLPEANRTEQSLHLIPTTVLNINGVYLIIPLKLFSLNLICNPFESLEKENVLLKNQQTFYTDKVTSNGKYFKTKFESNVVQLSLTLIKPKPFLSALLVTETSKFSSFCS